MLSVPWSALPGVDPVLRVQAAEAASVSGGATSPGGAVSMSMSISDSAQMAAGARPWISPASEA